MSLPILANLYPCIYDCIAFRRADPFNLTSYGTCFHDRRLNGMTRRRSECMRRGISDRRWPDLSMLNYLGRAQLSSDHRASDNWEQFEGRAKHDGDNNRRRDILWEGAALANHANLACCLGYPKSFGPVTTLPCTAQCNIEISQGGIASAPTSQRAFAFAALTANIPAAGGHRDSLNLSQRHPPYRSVSCAFQQVCLDMTAAHLSAPPDFQGQDSQLLTPSPRSIASAVHACLRDWTQGPGWIGRRIGDMQFSCPEPKSAYAVDMPGDPRQWWEGAPGCLEKVSSSHTSTTPTAPGGPLRLVHFVQL